MRASLTMPAMFIAALVFPAAANLAFAETAPALSEVPQPVQYIDQSSDALMLQTSFDSKAKGSAMFFDLDINSQSKPNQRAAAPAEHLSLTKQYILGLAGGFFIGVALPTFMLGYVQASSLTCDYCWIGDSLAAAVIFPIGMLFGSSLSFQLAAHQYHQDGSMIVAFITGLVGYLLFERIERELPLHFQRNSTMVPLLIFGSTGFSLFGYRITTTPLESDKPVQGQ